ncbi:MAG: thioredoxin family protein [Candidatus Desulfofervidaceae bacterium]|nr:thioredoxin family protein [Candidatus Desulfofervidaceae bacterium]
MLDLERVKDLKSIADQVHKIRLVLINSRHPEMFLQMEAFCQDIQRELPNIEFRVKKEQLLAYPAIKITDKEEKINLYYLGLPEKREWFPFFNALKAIATGRVTLGEEDIKKARGVSVPIEVKIFITAECAFCPVVVDLANQLAIASSMLRVFIIDGGFYPDLVKHYKVTASPTVIINEDYFLVGTEAHEKLVPWLEKASQKAYDSSVLKSLLKQAHAERVVELCLEKEECIYPLLALLQDKELFSRIGAMRVLEELAEKSPRLTEKAISKIVSMLDTNETRDKGDLLFLLGLIGSPEVISVIEKKAQEEAEEIKEIALEAIENIKKKYNYV